MDSMRENTNVRYMPQTSTGKDWSISRQKEKQAMIDFKYAVREDEDKPTPCPIRGCLGGSRKLREHVYRRHLPAIFHNNLNPKDPIVAKNRMHAVSLLATRVRRAKRSPRRLIHMLNESKVIPERAHITDEDNIAMITVCQALKMKIPPRFTLSPINHVAVLIHWRPLIHLANMLPRNLQIWFKEMTVKMPESSPSLDLDVKWAYEPNPQEQPPAGTSSYEQEFEPREWMDEQQQLDASTEWMNQQEQPNVPREWMNQQEQPNVPREWMNQQEQPNVPREWMNRQEQPNVPRQWMNRQEQLPPNVPGIRMDQQHQLNSPNHRVQNPDLPRNKMPQSERYSRPQLRVMSEGGIVLYKDPSSFPVSMPVFFPGWAVAVGIDPRYSPMLSDDEFVRLQSLSAVQGVCLGEIGLDRNKPPSTWLQQDRQLKQLLSLHKPNVPIILNLSSPRDDQYSQDVYSRGLVLMMGMCDPSQPIHLHNFHGTSDSVTDWLQCFPNTYFGFTELMADFNHEQVLALRTVPLDRLIIETDSTHSNPLIAAVSTKDVIKEMAKYIAIKLDMPLERVLKFTSENVQHLYYLQGHQ